MNDVNIRAARPEDAGRLAEIYAYFVENTAITFEYEAPTAEEFERRIRRTLEKYPYLVIERGGEICGYAYAGSFKERAAYDWSCELSVYIDRATEKCGLGRKIYTALERELCALGYTNLYACIAYPEQQDEYLDRNSPEFHAHLGYVQVGRFSKCAYKFGRWYDMIWMGKQIGEHFTDAPQPPVRRFDAENYVWKEEKENV